MQPKLFLYIFRAAEMSFSFLICNVPFSRPVGKLCREQHILKLYNCARGPKSLGIVSKWSLASTAVVSTAVVVHFQIDPMVMLLE